MKTHFIGTTVLILIVTVLFSSCKKADETDINAPTLQITSPRPGSNVTTNNAITIAGTVSSDVTTVTLEIDEASIVYANLVGTTFTVDVTLHDGKNKFKAKAVDHAGNYTVFYFPLYFPVLTLNDGAVDSNVIVIGQDNFTTNDVNQGSTVNANTLSGVVGTLFERINTSLYLPDSGNNRILRFDTVPTVSNAGANFVLGQADKTSAVTGIEANRFNAPSGVYIAGDQLFVADSGNHRVLIWDTIPNNDTTYAAHVLGWDDMVSPTSGCSANRLSNPTSVFVVDNKVVVLDQGNNRVLIWNSIPATDGAAADVVLGQTGVTPMDVCVANDTNGDGVSDGSPNGSTFNSPGGLWTDGTRLLVADTGNNRVLVWDTFPDSNSKAADHIIGQGSATSVTAELSQSGLDTPKSVTSNGNQVVVVDSGNFRVLIWSAFPTSDKPDADHVIGQLDFTSNLSAIGDKTFEAPGNVFVDRSNLFVVDGNRVLKFSNP